MKNNKAENLREKLKQALTSTARVISDDIHLKTIDEKNKKDLNFVDIENLNLGDSIRLTEISLPEGSEIPGLTEETDQMVVSVNAPKAVEEDPIIEDELEDGEISDSEEGAESAETDDAGSSEESDKEESSEEN